jgi:mannobiose 2-epimerase
VTDFRQRVETELRSGILPFWLNHTIDQDRGGFLGRISNDLTVDPAGEKGLILNARILWTFAKAYRVYKDPAYLAAAERAYAYLITFFLDSEFGGYYWMLDRDGKPTEPRKQIYGQAFTVYALAEFYHATGQAKALAHALTLVEKIEAAGHDPIRGGYFEVYNRDWSLAANQQLSAVDMNEPRSMNTHLHMLEAYAGLLHVHEEPTVRARLRELINLFLDRIIDPETHHFLLFFDEQWIPKSKIISFGHDIEGSWLLVEAAEILGEPELLARARQAAVEMAQAVYEQGVDTDGGLFYEGDSNGIHDSDKHWWPQAEAVVGFLNAHQISDEEHFLVAACRSWAFIEKFMIDRKHGEWFWLVSRSGVPGTTQDKVGPWKCPYHNARACMEVIERLDKIAAEAHAQ